MLVLVLNPGGNSLKAELVECDAGQPHAYDGRKLLSVSIEGIGKEAKLSQFNGKKVVATEPIEARDYEDATKSLLAWLGNHAGEGVPALRAIECVGVRVVHGGGEFTKPTWLSPAVQEKIKELEKLAPLHNKNAVAPLGPLEQQLKGVPVYGVFDTAFHRTIPEVAAQYAIPPRIASEHGIRRYGFHGISHRYLMERYAHLAGKLVEQCSLVTMHLESGCSVTAIRNGVSVDNTMGLTPLEGLMMGTRCGDIDASVVALLMREAGLNVDDVMQMLNKESGLLGVSGVSLDTRVLMKEYDSSPRVKLAMEMFCYRVVKAVGANLAALGGAEAIVFGGGIAENNTLLRERMGGALRWCGLEMDPEACTAVIDREGRLSSANSAIQAWVIPVEEGMQIAHECCRAHAGRADKQDTAPAHGA